MHTCTACMMHACTMHALHTCIMPAACMHCMHESCMNHTCNLAHLHACSCIHKEGACTKRCMHARKGSCMHAWKTMNACMTCIKQVMTACPKMVCMHTCFGCMIVILTVTYQQMRVTSDFKNVRNLYLIKSHWTWATVILQ